jgi:hypothetical protein
MSEKMENEFQMSIIGELTFSLGIQVKQTKQGTFVHQAKYTKDLMKKFNMIELKHVSTPMSTATSLSLDKDDDAIDQREYRSMIGSLLYLTAIGRTFNSSCVFVRAFRLLYALRIEQQFSGFLGILNTHSSL